MDEQQLQEQIVQLVQAAMQGNQKAAQQIQQIMQAAQQGDPKATQIAQLIQQVAQQLQQAQVQSARFGAKLNYIKQLRGECPTGYQMQYFKNGGRVCKRCGRRRQAGDNMPTNNGNVLDEFNRTASAKCGKKMKKATCGTKLPIKKCGGRTKTKKR